MAAAKCGSSLPRIRRKGEKGKGERRGGRLWRQERV